MKTCIISQDIDHCYTSVSKSFFRAFSKYCTTFLFSFNGIMVQNKYIRYLNKIELFSHINVSLQNFKLFNLIRQHKPDIILIVKGVYIYKSTLKKIKQILPKSFLICFNPDDPFFIGKYSPNIIHTIPLYDHYFIWNRSLIDKLINYGAVKVSHLPFAADLNLINKKTKNILSYDLGFIGNGDIERYNWIRHIHETLKKENFRIDVFGEYWPKTNAIKINKPRLGKAYFDTISSTKINLNILRLQNKSSTNMRTFEIPANEGFMMHEYSEEAIEYFRPGLEAEYFKTTDELIDKSIFYLKNEEIRKTIANNAYKRILEKKYTYESLVERIINLIK